MPETFWDRTPHARGRSSKRARSRSPGGRHHHHWHLPLRHSQQNVRGVTQEPKHLTPTSPLSPVASPSRPPKAHRVGFAVDAEQHTPSASADQDYFGAAASYTTPANDASPHVTNGDVEKQQPLPGSEQSAVSPGVGPHHDSDSMSAISSIHYTDFYREAPQKSYVQSLKPWNGRLCKDKWVKVMIRPFILFAYPAVLWSSMVYALAVGWLIVLSESVAEIYQNHESYNFTALQVGLVYISPFIGGVLGTAVAGKISDLIVRFMARRNDGVYEPVRSASVDKALGLLTLHRSSVL